MQGIKEEVHMQNLISNDQQNLNSPPAQTMGLDYLGGGNVGNNKESSTATGEENSLRAGAAGEEKSLRPEVTGEGIFLRARATGEENSLRSSITGEENTVRVHMFEKVVTPSDVGKLNRLVIPKHQAQKYFPLEKPQREKGLLLRFEDNKGNEWTFRYSYWSSSQSYVFTKGWNRFVREIDLHAGDVVSFHRAADRRNTQQHFYISWRRRTSKSPLICCSVRRNHTQHLCHPPYLISSLAALQYNGGAAMSSSASLPNNGGAAVASFWVEERNNLESTVTGHLISCGLGQNWGGERNISFGHLNPSERPAGVVSYPAQYIAAAGSGKRVRLFGVTL